MRQDPKKKQLRVAIIRGGDWSSTQAIPRVLDMLSILGLQPTILCWDKSGKEPKREIINGVEVLRFRKHILPRSILLFAWWPVWWAWLLWQLMRGRFALVHAMDIDTLVPAVAGKMALCYRLIYDSRDALGLSLTNVRFPVPQLFTCLDRLFTLAADGLLWPGGSAKIYAEYFGRRVARRVPVVQVLNVPMAETPSRYRTPTARPLRINMSGAVSPVRGAFVAVEAFGKRTDTVLDIVAAMRYESIREQFEAMSNATLHGRVPYERALELMDQADLIWLHYDTSMKTYMVASANKMFEAMMLGKPYLTTDGTWMAQVANQLGLGWSLPYGDIEGLRRLVEQLNATPSMLVKAGHRGRECFEKYCTWPKQRANMLLLYQHVLHQGDKVAETHVAGWYRFMGTFADRFSSGPTRRRLRSPEHAESRIA